jgi:hypothetical protein
MTYVDQYPDSKLGRARIALFALLEEHEAAGTIPTSARFLYYELVARGVVEKDDKRATKILHDALTDLRRGGHVPWSWIVDETRSLESYVGADSINAWVHGALDDARLDPWKGAVPLVLTESRSLAGALRDICARYAVRLASTNGQVGGFLHTDIVPVILPGTRVLYFGDWDLRGGMIEDNTRRVLEEAMRPSMAAVLMGFDLQQEAIGGTLYWERLALTEKQVKKYKLPKIIKHDRNFADGGAHEAVETEALSQELIVEILQQRLDLMLPEPLEKVLRREARQRAAMKRQLEKK